MSDQKETHKVIISEKNAALLDLKQRCDEKLAAAEAALHRSEDNARKLAEGKLASDRALAAVRVELEAAKNEAAERQKAMQKEADDLREQLAALQKRHSEQVVFDDRQNSRLSRFDCLTVPKDQIRSFSAVLADEQANTKPVAPVDTTITDSLKQSAFAYIKMIKFLNIMVNVILFLLAFILTKNVMYRVLQMAY